MAHSDSNKKVALVTGSNRGLGFETCKQLAEKGITPILTSRNPEAGLQAAKKLENLGLSVVHQTLDVVDQKSIARVYELISKQFGKLDILINNAGVFRDDTDSPEGASLFTTQIDTIRTTLETNTFGAIRMIQTFVPLMKKQNYGRIVNISSGMGQLSEMNGKWPAYRISKTALNAVTRIAADELQESNILVNSVCPGWVKTDMGGPDAELTPTEAVDTIVWLATLPDRGPTGGFFRERQQIAW
jgi:NAD(P)-dependent dehydrogenase (short-subunit alcohol dehydrogenase family)